MIGSIRWNFIIGALAFIVTFVLSMSKNIWLTTIIRSFYSFAILFILVFLCRFLLGTFAGLNRLSVQAQEAGETEAKGIAVDAVTPDEDEELHELLKPGADPKSASADFTPLNPPKLRVKKQPDPEEMAQAVRRMSDE
ncbi:hypothetical protein [Paenibacillus naphthalenovorans]|uniref:hypothetical protein n=1 Tax=Paenibacillus naphthalenovorans TaxID=162209 RepID=UPI003D26F397